MRAPATVRWRWARGGAGMLALGLAACGGSPPPAAPAPKTAPRGAAMAAPVPAIPPAPPLVLPTAAAQAALARQVELAVDSAADQQVLEALAAAHPDDGGSAANEGAGPNWDIDVERFSGHDRVQFYLDFFQGRARDRFAIWLGRMPRYEPLIRERLQREGLPSDLLYLALIESGFSNHAVSRARAVGMWQFMQKTARGYGLRVDRWVDERRDPIRATDAAARFLADLTRRFGSHYLAAAAYNAGGGKISRGLRRIGPGGGDEEEDEEEGFSDADFFRLYDTRLIRRETKDYVPKLIAAARIAKEPHKYGFDPVPEPPLEPMDSIVVTSMTGLDVLARLADTTTEALRAMNPHLLRGMTAPTGRTTVRLPAGRGATVAQRYAELPPSERVTYVVHRVKKGETPGGIAKRYRLTTATLVEVNPALKRRKTLRIGQELVIPTSGAFRADAVLATRSAPAARPAATGGRRTHTVRRGDTLSSIGRRYGVSVAELKKANNLSGTSIKAGTRLRIPA